MYAEEKCVSTERRPSSTFTKKCSQIFSSLVRSKLSSKTPTKICSSKAAQEFNFLGNSTPNIVNAINSGVFHMEEDDIVRQAEITFSPLTKRSLSSCTSGEERRLNKYRCNSLSSKLGKDSIITNGNRSLKTLKSEKPRQRNEFGVGESAVQQHYETHSGIKRTHRSNSIHALANSMYSTYSANHEINQSSASNPIIRQSINCDAQQITQQEHCHVNTGHVRHNCNLSQYDQLNNSQQETPAQTSLQTSFSSQSLPRKKHSGKAVASLRYSSTSNSAAFPTSDTSSFASCVGRFNFNESTADKQIGQSQLKTSRERELGTTETMFLGSGCSSSRVIQKSSTPVGNNPNYTYLSSSHQPYAPATASSQSRNLNSSFIRPVESEYLHQKLTSPRHQRFPSYPQPSSQPQQYGYHNTPQYLNAAQTSCSSSTTGTPPSSVENYDLAGIRSSEGRENADSNVFNADYSSARGMNSDPIDCKNSMRKKTTKSSNKLSSAFGRHSKVLNSSNTHEAAHNATWSIDHQNYNTDKNPNQADVVLHAFSPNNNRLTPSYESNSILLYSSQNHPTAIDYPSCSNSMSRSSSTQVVDPVRRSATSQEMTEPIIVLAKQLGNKELEIDRLKSQLSRRSSRNESRLAQYEDELCYSRDQASKLKTKLRLCEAECETMKAKKDELEKKLENVTKNHENKLEAVEKENAMHRKEFKRLKGLEEAYEKYLDEKDWIEKHTDSLNQKLDERESSLHISQLECEQLKLELERLKDCLKDKDTEISELSSTLKAAAKSSESEDEELVTDIQHKFSLKEMKRRGKISNREVIPSKGSTLKLTRRPNILLNVSSKSCSGLHLSNNNLAYRSSSSTPDNDSVAAPPSISSSGVYSFVGGVSKLGTEHSYCFSVSKQIERCYKKINDCQKRVTILLEATQRMANGGRPTKNDIIGSASESEPDLLDCEQFTVNSEGGSLNERAVEKALETHCSQIAKLYQHIESLHSSLLVVYGCNNRQQQSDESRDPNSCRVH